MDPEEQLKRLALALPDVRPPLANYVPAVRSGNLLFVSGHGPAALPGVKTAGRVGADLTQEEGYAAARAVCLQLLATVKHTLGSLSKVRRVVKLLGLVNSDPSFFNQPAVMNGCSDLLVEVFGDRGRHARSALGTSVLPNNIPVEIELVLEVED
jgi:enamine deaminase RidA (YjgF/YER057c/UK114 family)